MRFSDIRFGDEILNFFPILYLFITKNEFQSHFYIFLVVFGIIMVRNDGFGEICGEAMYKNNTVSSILIYCYPIQDHY